jgi:signal transduction histidine kinase
VSHELRTPLSSILGFVEMLTDDGGTMSAEHQRFLGIIDRNARRLLALIGDVLALAEVENTTGFRPEPTDLGALVEAVVQEQLPASAKRGHSLGVAVPDETLIASVDAKQLTQAAANLLANAIKYTPEGGTIAVSVAVEDSGQIAIRVSDSGIGISAADLEHLTERFFRAHSATDAGIPGTGLGLAICAGIAAAHGGTLTVQSELGHGSEFGITIPQER